MNDSSCMVPPIEIQPIDDPAALVVFLKGRIDAGNVGAVQQQVRAALNVPDAPANLIIHCGGLETISSAGVGGCAQLLKTARMCGGDMVLLGLQPTVYEVFRSLGLGRIFPIRGSMEEAARYFQTSEHTVACPHCGERVIMSGPGRFRCSTCGALVSIDRDGGALLG